MHILKMKRKQEGMKTKQIQFNEALNNLIFLEEVEPVHEGMECGMGYCTSDCMLRIAVHEHNEALLYLKSLAEEGCELLAIRQECKIED